MWILLSITEGPDDRLLDNRSVKKVIKIKFTANWCFGAFTMTPNAKRLIGAGQTSSCKYYKFWKISDEQ